MITTQAEKEEQTPFKARLSSRFSWLKKWPELYPSPDPMPRDRSFWLSMTAVLIMVLLFAGYFSVLMVLRQNAFATDAEDLGLYDQSIWSVLHGQVLHQTICNVIGDTNCASPAGMSRFSIHFEPILFLLAPLYLFIPGPKTLLILQAIVVASGGLPAFWLARLRLRSNVAAVAIVALYLLFPALQWATTFDFHAVTLDAAFLLFVFYFMHTRQNKWLFVFAILAAGTKEEVPGIIALCGLWIIVFQKRWRVGLALVIMGVVWTGIAYALMKHFSPIGQPMLSSRYSANGGGPVGLAKVIIIHPRSSFYNYVLEPAHKLYLRKLLAPTAYLALLAPWILVLAAPDLLVNLLSSDPQQYSGQYQYNANIVPVLVFATIETLVWVFFVARWFLTSVPGLWLRHNVKTVAIASYRVVWSRKPLPATWMRVLYVAFMAVLLVGIVYSSYRKNIPSGNMPYSHGFVWPVVSSHMDAAQSIINMIPANASVSAQSELIPHISERESIYQFPYADTISDYIFLDTSGPIYPFPSSGDYINEVRNLLFSGNYGVVAAENGYLLLKRGLHSPAVSPYSVDQLGDIVPMANAGTGDVNDPDLQLVLPELGQNFCTYTEVSQQVPSQQQIKHPLQATFVNPSQPNASLEMLGYTTNTGNTLNIGSAYIKMTTFWRVPKVAPTTPMQLVISIEDSSGTEHFATSNISTFYWCQTNQWKPGSIITFTTLGFGIRGSNLQPGNAHYSFSMIPLGQESTSMMDPSVRMHVQSATGASYVKTISNGTAVQGGPLKLVP
jgi:uncharacterized membrane protein